MTKILGLDIGTNSVGGALINLEEFGKKGNIEWLGSRVIPVDGDMLQKFESGGQVETKAAFRRQMRMARRLKQRYKLRRTRLIKTFKALGWVNEHFPENFKEIKKNNPDFEFNINEYLPLQEETVKEALIELIGRKEVNQLLSENNGNIPKKPDGKLDIPISEDWIIYYLRKKALYKKISVQELARILYMMNQRRGFKSSRKDLEETSVLDYQDFNKMVDNGIFIDEDEKTLETHFVEITKIKSIKQKDDEKDNKGNFTFIITPESEKVEPWEEKRKKKPEWEGKEFKLLITLKTKKNGKVDQLKPKVPSSEDWNLTMVALDNELQDTGKHVGEFFFDKLCEDKNYKIRQQVIKREKYEKELKAIWDKQLELNKDLKELNEKPELLEKLAATLYPTQAKIKGPKYKEITSNNLYHLIANDVIYYQRDLKSQKGLIDECRYEEKQYYDKNLGEIVTKGYNVAPKSSPEFQEFRIWQDIHNIRVIKIEKEINGKSLPDVDVTYEYIDDDVKSKLFKLFDSTKELTQSQLLKSIHNDLNEKEFKINLFANRERIKGNETKAAFRNALRKCNREDLLDDQNKFYKLWHILYSIDGKDADQSIRKALTNPKHDFKLTNEVIEELSNLQEFPKQYAAYSSKAIQKLLPLMRSREHWNKNSVSNECQERLVKVITGEEDENIDYRTRNQITNYFKKQKRKDVREAEISDFQGLPVWMACYAVYGKHSERKSDEKFKSWEDLGVNKMIPNNSLRNPIVEQIIRETLHVVKDVWKNYGQPDQIHIEMSRELKNPKEERERIANNQNKNKDEKERIRKLLGELKEGNPNSPIDVNKFRLWKQNGGINAEDKFNELFNNKNEVAVSENEIKKYRLWAEQNHISPYTGNPIPLNKLFTPQYEVEHIIPQSKLKNDSLSNLVISESVVNDFKGDRLARTMIEEHGGQPLQHKNSTFTLLSKEEYEAQCEKTFKNQRGKLKNLLREDIPDDFVERQLNDNRYITRKVGELLYPVANEKEGIVFTTGTITDELKQKWGMNTIWRELMKPRYERLEKILEKQLIVPDEKDVNKFHLNSPEPNDPVDIKRIDHRHHAMDAVIVASTSRAHIKYLNSLNSHKHIQQYKYLANKGVRDFIQPWKGFSEEFKKHLQRLIISHKVNCQYDPDYPEYSGVIARPQNKYKKWTNRNGQWRKEYQWQQDNPNWWAVRKSMFKEPLGLIYLKEIKEVSLKKALEIQAERQKGIKDHSGKPRDYIYDKLARQEIRFLIEDKCGGDIMQAKKQSNTLKDSKSNPIKKVRVAFFKEFAASRVPVDNSFTYKKIKAIPYAEKTINRWEEWEKNGKNYKGQIFPNDTTKWPIAFLLKKHLDGYKTLNGRPDPNAAFSGEGYEALTKKNGGQPIKKVTTYESKAAPIKFNGKILETDKGGNAFFVIYKDKNTGEHIDWYTPPLYSNEEATGKDKGVINRLVNKEPIAEPQEGLEFFTLSPEDLVYVPKDGEDINANDWNGKDKQKVFDRTYKMVSCTGKQCFFIPHNIARALESNDKELGPNNKAEKSWDEKMIKKDCVKIELDRLGNIIKANNEPVNI